MLSIKLNHIKDKDTQLYNKYTNDKLNGKKDHAKKKQK